MTKFAILIAVENYSNSKFEKVLYAKNDAMALAEALALHGFDRSNQTLLIDGDATKAAIESKVKRVVRGLGADDVLYFYYAGRGFSKAGQHFITCPDTQPAAPEETSVALEPIFEAFRGSAGKQLALFLDDRESGLRAVPDLRGVDDRSPEREFERLFDGIEQGVCFAACRSDESSYPANHHKHGAWTYHLVEALKGNAPLALRQGLLVASSLQNYLKAEVARTLSIEHTTSMQQTPWMCGTSNGDFVVADLRPILRAGKDADADGNEGVTEVSFLANKSSRVKSLSGWKSTFKVPDRANDSAQSFVAKLSHTEVKDDLDRVFERLKQSFGFTRRQMTASEPLDGSGSITTPAFNYSIAVALNPENLSEVIWTRTVDAIKKPEQILSDAFGAAFDNVFDTLEFSFRSPFNVADFIDAAEAARSPELKIEYDRDCTYCHLMIAGSTETVRVTAHALSIVHRGPRETRTLIESFNLVKALVRKHDVPGIAFVAPAK